MNCPYCNQEMESGFLQGWCMGWATRKHKFVFVPGKDELLLANNKLKPCAFSAYLCRDCHKVTFNFIDKLR